MKKAPTTLTWLDKPCINYMITDKTFNIKKPT